MKRVVAITGGSRGIGLATARRFAKLGDWLAINYFRTPDHIDETIATARANGGEGFGIRADISDPSAARSFVEAAEERFGRIDVLINNAGLLIAAPAVELTWEQWQKTIALNLTATWCCTQAALPGMIRRKSGRIINISSEIGLIGLATYAAYAASKGGVIALTKALAKELAPLGVLVNSVAPGPVDTEMLRNDSIEYNDHTRNQVPLRRFGTPDEIAAVIEAIAGEAGSYMVGQIVSPNGGTAI